MIMSIRLISQPWTSPIQPHIHRESSIFTGLLSAQSKEEVKRTGQEHVFIVAEAEESFNDEVHHEVGAIGFNVDIISVAVCPTTWVKQRSGNRWRRDDPACQHGGYRYRCHMANIAAAHGFALRLTDQEGEMVMPTGAAAIAAAVRENCLLPAES